MTFYELDDIEKMNSEGDIDGLIQALNERQSVEVRKAAADFLGRSGDPRAEKPLEAARKDSNPEIVQAATAATLRFALASGAGQKRGASSEKQLKGFDLDSTHKVPAIVLFVVGVVLLAIAGVSVGWGVSENSASPVVKLAAIIIPVLVIYYLAEKGMDWQPPANSAADYMRAFVLTFLAATVIGLIPVCFWIGRGTMRRVLR